MKREYEEPFESLTNLHIIYVYLDQLNWLISYYVKKLS